VNSKRFLSALSDEELHELCGALPAEYEARGLEPPAGAGALFPHPDARAAAEGRPARADGDPPTPQGTAESLTAQLASAGGAYRSVITQINDSRERQEQVPVANQARVATEFATWLANDKLAFIAGAQEADPTLRFTVVAAPNVLASAQEIADVAREFGEAQPCQTYVWDELYGMYTSEQLSGTDPDDDTRVLFSLMPNRLDDRLYGDVDRQREVLADMRAATPALHVPSVLESVTYWHTLRNQRDALADSAAFDATYIRHFDLPARHMGNFQGLPSSCSGGGAGPSLSYSRVDVGSPGRVAVGARPAGSTLSPSE
jgi:hypothetical protein